MHKTEAIVYKSKNQKLSLEEIEFSDPGPNEVIVKNLYAGLCGSILINLSRKPKNPELLGHEGTGIILNKGKNVKHVKIGDNVLISWMPYGADEKTKYLNFTEFYYKGKKFKTLIYTLSKKSKVHSQFVSKIPHNINLKNSSIVGCAVISGYLPIIKSEKINKNSKVAIYGMGGLGLLAVNALKRTGVKEITAIDIDQKKLNFSKKFGAKYIVNFNNKNFDDKLKKISNNEGYDYIFDFVGSKIVQQNCLTHLKKCIAGFRSGGSLGIVGFHYDKLEISAKDLLMNENTIYGIRGGSAIMKVDLPKIYKDIKNKKLYLNRIVSNTYKLKDINLAINKLKNGKILGRSVISI
jgi:S-(hydroxymethyl)glutathione dehydrogenase/alcohol dehydrogenase